MSFKIKISAADRLFSLVVRYLAKWECERCGKRYPERSGSLQCSHFWSRGKKSVRFDLDNAAALCAGCHQFFTANPAEHRDFFMKRLGEIKFQCLEVRAKSPCRVDEKAIAIGLKMMLREMGVTAKGRGPALSTFTPVTR